MSSLNPFRSLPIVLLKPDIWGRWLSALKSRRPSEFLNPRSPEFLPAMATLVLLGVAGLQLALPSATRLPPDSDLVPRRAQEPATPQTPSFPIIFQDPIFAPDRKPDDTAIPVEGGMSGFTVLGIAMAGDTATAVVRGPDGTIERIKPGDEEEGWRLVSVAFDGLTFERNKERRLLMLVKAAPVVHAAAHPGPAGASNTATMANPNADSSDSSDSDDSSDKSDGDDQ
jgi:hypothetical protein